MMKSLISVDVAQQLIDENTPSWGTEQVALANSSNRILAEEVRADRDFPPFDRVTMDGFAIMASDTTEKLPIQELQLAGEPAKTLLPGSAIEIMTGAVLPHGADAVIPYEKTSVDLEKKVVRFLETVDVGQNIHRKGSDTKSGTLLIGRGQLIEAPQQAVLATCGYERVLCFKRPNVALVSTGDEIVGVGETPKLHQIRSSNLQMIESQLNGAGVDCLSIHLDDNQEAIEQGLNDISGKYDVIILSGGVSKGKADYVLPSVKANGFDIVFHGVSQRPGKPLLFAKKQGTLLFGLPGNPMAALSCFFRYVKPVVLGNTKREYVVLGGPVKFDKPLTYFLPVKFEYINGTKTAYSVHTNGSGDMIQALSASGFVELPAEKNSFNTGDVLPYYPFACS